MLTGGDKLPVKLEFTRTAAATHEQIQVSADFAIGHEKHLEANCYRALPHVRIV
jgi:hypothetical protein